MKRFYKSMQTRSYLISFLIVPLLFLLCACSSEENADEIDSLNSVDSVLEIEKPVGLITKTSMNDSAKHSARIMEVFKGKLLTEDDLKKVFSENWTKKDLLYDYGQESECVSSDEYTLYIRYVDHYPSIENGAPVFVYTDVKVPPVSESADDGRSPEITEVVFKGQKKWERNHYKVWWYGVDEDWRKQMQDELVLVEQQIEQATEAFGKVVEQAAETGGLSAFEGPEAKELQRLNQRLQELMQIVYFGQGDVKGLNEKVYERITVTNPAPQTSFRFDNVEKHGSTFRVAPKMNASKLREYFDSFMHEDQQAISSGIIEALEPLQALGEDVQIESRKTILGYTCDIKAINSWDAEVCTYDFGGDKEVLLWMRIDKRVTEAVHIQEQPCVQDSLFLPPVDVEFDKYAGP